MIGNILKKVFGSRNSRLIKEYAIRVKKINDLEQLFEKKSDQELKLFTLDLKKDFKTLKISMSSWRRPLLQ